MNKYYLLCPIFTLMGAFGAMFFKRVTNNNKSFFRYFTDWNFYLGGFLYFVGALLNIYVLHYLKYTVVLPITSITYIWTMIISYFIMKEKITKKKLIGVSLILIGAYCITL
ncbi:DMT family transporter [Inconstantimicrobium mannanitabidum]|uniref:Permease n=1 Tax=Inconstantimicrobium mannanitabidum TaxID=1604901 RepID=A0ACB5RG84_9CLOT|nr:DMT family transporter [Clostridium sp. TW13]GKX68076.1 permease [Clostridium sp. TW13]